MVNPSPKQHYEVPLSEQKNIEKNFGNQLFSLPVSFPGLLPVFKSENELIPERMLPVSTLADSSAVRH